MSDRSEASHNLPTQSHHVKGKHHCLLQQSFETGLRSKSSRYLLERGH